MDGDSFLPTKSVVGHGIRTGLLISILTLVGTRTVFANKVLSMLLCAFGLVVFCLERRGSDKIGKMRNNDPVSNKLTLRPYCATWSETLEANKSIVGVPNFRQRLKNTCRQRTHSDESTL